MIFSVCVRTMGTTHAKLSLKGGSSPGARTKLFEKVKWISGFLSKSRTKNGGLFVVAIHYCYHRLLRPRTCVLVDSRSHVESGEVIHVSENGKKARKVWLGQINCAHCGKPNSVRVEKETIEPAVPAETEIRVTVEKSLQTVLA
jgi:hypothetical protein